MPSVTVASATAIGSGSFLDAGIVLPGSSDRPVVQGAPLLGIHDLVNQRTASGPTSIPHEALTADQATAGLHLGLGLRRRSTSTARVRSHRASSPTSSCSIGISTTIDPDGIADIEVLATMVGGRFAFDGAGVS